MLEAVASDASVESSARNKITNQVKETSHEGKWKLLTPEEQHISAPTNPFESADPSGNDRNNRCNHKETFDMPAFDLASKACHRIGQNQNISMEGNKPKMFDVPRTVGIDELEWLEKSNANEFVHPVE